MNDLLIAVRAVHFASGVVLAGTMIFRVCIAGPPLRRARAAPAFGAWRRQSLLIAWIGLGAAVLSGAAWLVVLASHITGRPLSEVFSSDVVWRLLTRTRFGTDWSARFIAALLLAGGLAVLTRCRDVAPRGLNATLAMLAALLLGSLVWAGHASGTHGNAGNVHIAADVLHLVAAGAWVGGLVPLALLFAAARRATNPDVAYVTREATLRFSTLGMIAVGTILATGMVNTYLLAGSVPALVATDYGHLLLVKIGIFVAMVCIAAFNRGWLMPRLSSARAGADAQRQLQRNSLIEAAMGLSILVIVGALGTLAPGLHAVPSAHMPGM